MKSYFGFAIESYLLIVVVFITLSLIFFPLLNNDLHYLSIILNGVGIIAAICYYILKSKQKILPYLNFNKIYFKPFYYGVQVVLSWIILFLLMLALNIKFKWFEIPIENHNNNLIQSIYIVFLAPIFEELYFRKILLEEFLKKVKPFLAIISVSVLFSLIHFSPYQILNTFVGGCILGLVYFVTKNLWLSIILHLINNFISIFVLTNFNIEAYAMKVNLELIFISIIIFIFYIIYYLRKLIKLA